MLQKKPIEIVLLDELLRKELITKEEYRETSKRILEDMNKKLKLNKG